MNTWIRLIKALSFELRRNTPFGIILVALLLGLLLRSTDLGGLDRWKYALPITLLLIASGIAIFDYLQRQRRSLAREPGPAPPAPQGAALQSEYNKYLHALLAHQIQETPIKPLSTDIDDRVSVQVARQYHLNQIRGIHDGIIYRFKAETERLGRRANVNLTVGVLISTLGFLALGYYVFFEPHTGDLPTRLIDLTIRLSLVIFVEVFAYFFLDLYRSSLLDIKYFQNEMTNMTARSVALEAAFAVGEPSIIKKLCEDLSKMERNFVLKKNETTQDLKRTELFLAHGRSFSAELEKLLSVVMRRVGRTAKADSQD